MDQDLYEYPMTEAEKVQLSLDMSIQQAFNALDEIMAIGADPETRHLVLKERIAMARLLSRVQLINSFIQVSKPGQLKVVSNVAVLPAVVVK